MNDLRFTICNSRGSDDSGALANRNSQIVNPVDGSLMRLIPAGEFIMGSTPEQIEAARLMDIYGSEFSLLDETRRFDLFRR
jgi:hypothetical protein